MRSALRVFPMLLLVSLWGSPGKAQDLSAAIGTGNDHTTAEWRDVSAHLPDLLVEPPEKLEEAADVLRARRYPGDALRFYNAALTRGGEPHTLLKKMGITCLELQQPALARLFFQRAVRLNKKDAVAWNDLGAAEFTLHSFHAAIGDYRHAVRLTETSAVYHSNLALAYFETGHGEQARRELGRALSLDPDVLHKKIGSGYNAQVLASVRYGEVCFEMARIYAVQGNVEVMLDWLTKASERGFGVREAMDHDAVLRPLLADARVQVLLKNTQMLHAGNKAPGNVPSLGRGTP